MENNIKEPKQKRKVKEFYINIANTGSGRETWQIF
jgi:hypothetical protein